MSSSPPFPRPSFPTQLVASSVQLTARLTCVGIGKSYHFSPNPMVAQATEYGTACLVLAAETCSLYQSADSALKEPGSLDLVLGSIDCIVASSRVRILYTSAGLSNNSNRSDIYIAAVQRTGDLKKTSKTENILTTKENMKTIFALAVALAASMASAGVIITPIKANQVVAKSDGDCFFGVTTPDGCGLLRN